MKKRRRQGATLGLVAVCVLVIIVIGIGCFFLAKIFGGGREVANATDAGALNIAKNAMKRSDTAGIVAVDIDANDPSKYPDFIQCADPIASRQISLLTYNRCVAQAILVAVNAHSETAAGSTQASGNAGRVLQQLTRLGNDLKGKLTDNTKMVSYFDKVTNDTRMWGNNPVKVDTSTQSTYVTAFMKPKQSTNVYFVSRSLPATVPGTPANTGDLPTDWEVANSDIKPPNGSYKNAYLRGYEPINVPGIGSIMGVPVFPQQNPHLVAKAEFDRCLTAPIPSVPPNAFSVASNSTENKSGVVGGAVAAAIVGAVKQQTAGGGTVANYDFPAAIPGGYIEIVNPNGNTLPPGYRGFDNSDNIFNNELYYGPGIDLATNSNGSMASFSNTDMGANQAWAAYNASTGTDQNNHDASLYPPSIGHPRSAMRITHSRNTAATVPSNDVDLLQITNNHVNCRDALDDNTWDNTPCNTFITAMQATYSPGPQGSNTPNPLDSQPIYSNVDLVKGQVIAAFHSGARNVSISAPGGQSGLGVYPNGSTGFNPTPFYDAPIQRTGTIDQLLDQVVSAPQINGACNKAKILASMSQRCYEIKPDATPTEIAALWQQQLPMGKTFYIYLDTASNKLVITETQPPTYKGASPDGNPNDTNTICVSNYGLSDTLVDTPVSGGLPSDDNLHAQPYTHHSNNLNGQDHASWVLSSGYQNLLGKLQFSNTTSGQVENFSRPN